MSKLAAQSVLAASILFALAAPGHSLAQSPSPRPASPQPATCDVTRIADAMTALSGTTSYRDTTVETFSSGATGDVAITMLMHEDVLDPATWSRTSAGTALGQSGVVDEVRTGDQYWSRSAGGDWASMPLGQAISDRPWLLTNVAVDLSGTKIDGATIKTKTAGDACAITVQLPRYPDVSISLTFLGADPLPNTIGILSTAGSQTKVGKDAAPTDVDSVVITINPGDVAPIVAPIAP